ncbi:MAG: response regulator [Crocinitomicaceae bacterium]|jgi:two-component system response regulator|nr:response regulator [Crocinitomicaceae bacterium]
MDKEVEILLVEDNVSDAELTIRALKKQNIANKLIHLKDGAQAIDYLFGEGDFTGRNTDNVPRVILLDLKMPKVTGIEVLERIKADERTRKIPVVVLTSSKEDPDIQRCYDLGVNSYVVKPVDFDSFAKAVGNLGMYWVLLNQAPNKD